MGSNPIRVVRKNSIGILAQLGEHLPYKQRVIGSSPIGPTIRRRGMNGVDIRHHILSRYGGIGRHKRLKISRGRLRAGSSPATSIGFLLGIHIFSCMLRWVLFLLNIPIIGLAEDYESFAQNKKSFFAERVRNMI